MEGGGIRAAKFRDSIGALLWEFSYDFSHETTFGV
jgi:hypothetical protein